MIVVVPFFQGDQHLAVEMAAWLNEIGTYPNHDLLIVHDHRAAPMPDLGRGFRSVEELVIKDDAYNRWPQSCNVMWQTAAKHIARTKKQPWLWLEVDAVLLKASGLDEIALEYEQALKAGKWFVGDYVNVTGVAPHCSGVAVYPWDIFEHAGEALLAHETAWDSVGAAQIVPQMQRSGLILHVWKGEPFATWDDVQRRIFDVKRRACLYHADKAGSLYPLLRANMKRGDADCKLQVQSLTHRDTLQTARAIPAGDAVPTFEPERAAIFEFRNGELQRCQN